MERGEEETDCNCCLRVTHDAPNAMMHKGKSEKIAALHSQYYHYYYSGV